jgi:hypothetical protein
MVADVGRRRLAVEIGLVLGIAMSWAGSTSVQADQDSADSGDVIVVDPVNNDRALSEGDSNTPFSLKLPDGAACPGDSANDDWRVQSFLVPAETDMDSLRFNGLRPDGDGYRYRSLRYVSGDIYVMEMTEANEGPGQPGRIVTVPPLTMAFGTVVPGSYRMGIACTPPSWEVEKYWDVNVEIAAAPEVEPGGLKWSVMQPSVAATSPAGSSGSLPWIPLLVAVLGIGGVVLFTRRRRSPTSEPKKAKA